MNKELIAHGFSNALAGMAGGKIAYDIPIDLFRENESTSCPL